MAESIHDWAVKLGMLRDEASFSAGEKLMENFTQSVIKNDNRVKQSAKERADAEKQARLMAEGEKIRQANLSPADSFEEKKVHLGELYVSGAIGVETFTAAMVKLNAEQDKVLGGAARLKAEGLFDQETRKLLQEKHQYEETQAKRSAARISGYNRQQRQDAAREAAEALRIASVNSKAQLQIDGAFEQETRRLRTEQDAYNEEVTEANRLLNRYGNLAVQAATDIQRLNAMLAAGTISAQQHGVAVTEATRRMNSMRGGAGNMGFAMGELARGAEDFITVMSITGFNIESVGMAMRGAGNNISQAANLMAGPMTGAVIGVAAILGGQLVSSFFKAGKAANNYSDAIERAIRVTSDFYNKQLEAVDLADRLKAVNNEQDPVANRATIKENIDELKKLEIEHAKAMNALNQNASTLQELLVPVDLSDKYDKLYAKFYADQPELVASFRQRFGDINKQFVEAAKGSPEDALKAYRVQMKKLNEEIRSGIDMVDPTDVGSDWFLGRDVGGMEVWDAEIVNNAEAYLESTSELNAVMQKHNALSEEALDLERKRKEAQALLTAAKERQAAADSTFRVNTLEPLYEQLELAEAKTAADEASINRMNRLNQLQMEYGANGAEGLKLANDQLQMEQDITNAQAIKTSQENTTSNQNNVNLANSTSRAETEALQFNITYYEERNRLIKEGVDSIYAMGIATAKANQEQRLNEAKFQAEERKRQEAERIALDDAYEKMKLKSEELLMVSKLTEQEKLTYDYAKRRAEIFASMGMGPLTLEKTAAAEAVFRNEMMAKKNDFETEWKKSAAPMSIDAVSANKALGDASKSMMAATGETKDKELIRAMKAVEDAIRNPNRNRGVMLVEVQ